MSKSFSREELLEWKDAGFPGDFGLSDSESEEEGGQEVYCYSGQPVCDADQLSALERMVDAKIPASPDYASAAEQQGRLSSGCEEMEQDSPGENKQSSVK